MTTINPVMCFLGRLDRIGGNRFGRTQKAVTIQGRVADGLIQRVHSASQTFGWRGLRLVWDPFCFLLGWHRHSRWTKTTQQHCVGYIATIGRALTASFSSIQKLASDILPIKLANDKTLDADVLLQKLTEVKKDWIEEFLKYHGRELASRTVESEIVNLNTPKKQKKKVK